ncbi:hypothetical protein SAMN05444000_10464 [Shimia gijangensis]|uniref:Uncharacterized protein n=1 Tax=Shimia gijangensis TaxID=1470563 RepID=A0A1M6FG42_9RHOB|nr:hypothetical protein [Shimia gijangensis]SHI96626.1 hypothetical protein SAMN05444000_10464 [Shimia gijangensis]
MIEIAHTTQMQQAFKAAHAERGQALLKILSWAFRSRNFPLRQSALTEPSRCA